MQIITCKEDQHNNTVALSTKGPKIHITNDDYFYYYIIIIEPENELLLEF